MTLDLILTNITIWLIAVAGLFVAIGASMEESVKPFLHTVLDSLPITDTKKEILKPFLVRVSALVVGYVIALPLHEVYNMPTAMFGRYAHPVWGVLPAVFLAVFLGRQIHDRWGKKENPAGAG